MLRRHDSHVLYLLLLSPYLLLAFGNLHGANAMVRWIAVAYNA